MADYDAPEKPKPKGDHSKLLEQARKNYDRAYERERSNIELAYDDLEFLSGNQWPDDQRKQREEKGRPVLTINQLPQFVHQITGDIRQMKPAIKVVPVDSGSDEKVADLRAGLIRYVENRSDASAIYFRQADSQVACGIGGWRVITEYGDNSTFNQEIGVATIEDPVAVLWDPDATKPCKEDAEFCFVPVDVSRGAFEEQHPGVSPSEFDDTKWEHNSEWLTDDYVRVAEYWLKEPDTKTLALSKDGAIADITDADESVLAYHQSIGSRIEKRKSTKIVRYLITSGAVLEGPEDWPGPDIPIVPVFGEEIRIGRKVIRNGIVRHAKDPARMSNYFHSAHTETVALQPKAPFIVTETNVAKYQGLWERANTENDPYLVFEPDTKNGGQAPQRVQPPVSSQGILDGLTMAKEDLRSVIGIYDASLGKQSNETSGKAILARQREGDVGSYLYVDNFARAVRRTGIIINNLIPYIYDTERTIRIMGEDGKIDVLEINKANGIDPESGETVFTYDITSGSYDVVAMIGPSYTTRREEAKEGMTEFVRAAPEAGGLILDLIAKAQDWPMSDDIAKRFRANLPPHILKMEELEKQGATPEQIQQVMDQERANQPPPPELMKAQMDQQATQAKLEQDGQVQAARLELDTKNAETAAEVKQAEMQQAAALAEQNAQLEMAKMAEASRLKEAELAQAAMLERERMLLDAETRITIARINAESKERDADLRAMIAKYQTDNRPQPSVGQ